jgi:putative inorganic carbon (hco3(-)) transporter
MRLGQFWELLAGLAFCLGSVALVLTYTRGSWLACICSLGIVVLWGWRLLRPSHKALCLFGVIILASGILIQKAVSDRLLDKQAAESRIPLMQMALRMIADHPLLGVGANNYTVQMEQYATKNLSGDWMYAVHNKYLLIWAETGPGALIAFLWFIGATLRRGWNAWRAGSPRFSPLALGLTAGLVGLSISILSEPARGVMILLLLIASLITAIDRWGAQARRQHTNSSARSMASSNAL